MKFFAKYGCAMAALPLPFDGYRGADDLYQHLANNREMFSVLRSGPDHAGAFSEMILTHGLTSCERPPMEKGWLNLFRRENRFPICLFRLVVWP
jgi:hypothetical protein